MRCCSKKASVERRKSPPQYISTVSIQDRIFFLRLLFRWTGSIWKMLWIDLFIFILFYIGINLLYHFVISKYPVEKHNFEKFVYHVRTIASSVPLSFMLGFFVSAVLARWWSVCMTIPWLSQPSILFNCYINPPNQKDVARKIRLNLLRYMNFAWILALKTQSLQIFKRFQLPGEAQNDFVNIKKTFESLFFFSAEEDPSTEPRKPNNVENVHYKIEKRLQKINDDLHVKKNFGYLVSNKEIQIFNNLAKKANNPDYQGDYWIPLQWCTRILVKARQAGMIIGDFEFSELVKIVDGFRGGLGTLFMYSEINIPLVYTQVIIIAVYSFFLAEIFSSQLIRAGETVSTSVNTTTTNFNSFDNYIPIFSIFKFIFFMGWFKTAASLLNPLGNDSHDLPTSSMLDFNLMISIASGDASDDIFPEPLVYEGEPGGQLEMLDNIPDIQKITMEEFEVEDANPVHVQEESHLNPDVV